MTFPTLSRRRRTLQPAEFSVSPAATRRPQLTPSLCIAAAECSARCCALEATLQERERCSAAHDWAPLIYPQPYRRSSVPDRSTQGAAGDSSRLFKKRSPAPPKVARPEPPIAPALLLKPQSYVMNDTRTNPLPSQRTSARLPIHASPVSTLSSSRPCAPASTIVSNSCARPATQSCSHASKLKPPSSDTASRIFAPQRPDPSHAAADPSSRALRSNEPRSRAIPARCMQQRRPT